MKQQRPTRRNEPIPRRRRRVAGSKLGEPRSIQQVYPDISPQAVATWEKMCQQDPPPPAVKAWRDWEARQRKRKPPTAGGSDEAA